MITLKEVEEVVMPKVERLYFRDVNRDYLDDGEIYLPNGDFIALTADRIDERLCELRPMVDYYHVSEDRVINYCCQCEIEQLAGKKMFYIVHVDGGIDPGEDTASMCTEMVCHSVMYKGGKCSFRQTIYGEESTSGPCKVAAGKISVTPEEYARAIKALELRLPIKSLVLGGSYENCIAFETEGLRFVLLEEHIEVYDPQGKCSKKFYIENYYRRHRLS